MNIRNCLLIVYLLTMCWFKLCKTTHSLVITLKGSTEKSILANRMNSKLWKLLKYWFRYFISGSSWNTSAMLLQLPTIRLNCTQFFSLKWNSGFDHVCNVMGLNKTNELKRKLSWMNQKSLYRCHIRLSNRFLPLLSI